MLIFCKLFHQSKTLNKSCSHRVCDYYSCAHLSARTAQHFSTFPLSRYIEVSFLLSSQCSSDVFCCSIFCGRKTLHIYKFLQRRSFIARNPPQNPQSDVSFFRLFFSGSLTYLKYKYPNSLLSASISSYPFGALGGLSTL